MLEQDDRACPARPIECAGAFEDGAGERVTDYRQVQVGHARNLNVARQVLRRQAATHSAPRVDVCARARFQRRHADEWRLAGGTEPADPDDHDRVDARERVVDDHQDRRGAGFRVDLRVWCLDLKRHDATGIAEGGLQEPLAREAVRELLLLPVVDGQADVVLLGAGCRALAGLVRRGDLGSERVARLGHNRPRRADVAGGVGRGLLRSGQVHGVVGACEIQLALEQLHEHRAVRLDEDLELGASDGGRRGLSRDLECRASDEVLDISERAACLLRDRGIVKAAVLGEVRGGQLDLSAARQPGQRAVRQLNGGAAFGVGLDSVARLHDRACARVRVVATVMGDRSRGEEHGEGGDRVSGGGRGRIEPDRRPDRQQHDDQQSHDPPEAAAAPGSWFDGYGAHGRKR